MGKAISYSHRVKIVERCQKGHSYETIAQDFGYSVSGIRKIWTNYQKQGNAALETRYSNCGSRSQYGAAIRAAIAEIRDADQGADYVYAKLLVRFPNQKVPSARTLQRWWKRSKTNRPVGAPKQSEKKAGHKKSTILGK